jgi:hypothetical protein
MLDIMKKNKRRWLMTRNVSFFYLSIDLTYRIIYIELNEGSSLIDKNEDQTMDY